MLGLGIIGCGRVTALFHLKAIEQVDDIRVTAVSDIDRERLDDIKHDCMVDNAYLDYRMLLMNESVEAVSINTPPKYHEAIVKEALNHGKHVLCEKPLAKTVEALKEIQTLQEETGLVVLPAHNYVFSPSLNMMSGFIREGSIGEVTDISVSFENHLKLYRSETAFRENMETGIVEDVLPHVLSVIHPLVGHIDEVSSVRWWCKDFDVCDNMNTRMHSISGVNVDVTMSWTSLRPRFSVSVTGEAGRLFSDLALNPYKLELTIDGEHETIRERGLSWYVDLVKFRHPSFKNQYRHFYDLIRNGGTPKITISDEINILDIIRLVSSKMG